MSKLPDELYSITTRKSSREGVVMPGSYHIAGSSERLFRVPLALTPDEALFLAYPLINHTNTDRIKLFVHRLTPSKRHRVIKPKSLKHYYGVEHAIELNEYACFSRVRMDLVDVLTLDLTKSKREPVLVYDLDKPVEIGFLYSLYDIV